MPSSGEKIGDVEAETEEEGGGKGEGEGDGDGDKLNILVSSGLGWPAFASVKSRIV